MTDKAPLQVSRLLDADMQGALPALRCAALRAREIAARTGTPLITSRNGKVIEEYFEIALAGLVPVLSASLPSARGHKT